MQYSRVPAHVAATQSIRVLWPFLRYLATHEKGAQLLDPEGVDASLADPEGRIVLTDAGRMLEEAIRVTGDPAIGLHASDFIEPGDRDLLELAARTCSTLREALQCTIRYYRLMTDEATYAFEGTGDPVALCRQSAPGIPASPTASEFAFASIVYFIRRNTATDESRCVLELEYPEPDYVGEYQTRFRCPIRFSAGRNALLLPLDLLQIPMRAHCPPLAKAFALRADEQLVRLAEQDSLAERVRRLTADHLSSGQVTMQWISRCLGLSPPTLRRHLQTENATFTELVDEVRRQMAEQELRGNRSVSEIAFSLGFSSVSALDRAFKRWFGMLPSEYRAQISGGD